MYLQRNIPIDAMLQKKSVLLLGPRRSGKSALIRQQLKPDRVVDLLKADQFQALSFRPSSLRESLRSSDRLVAIDEIQKLPALLDEVHSMIEETECRFVLTGSSARKLKRTHTALLAGRTRRMLLHPLNWAELGGRFELEKYLLTGGLPPVYLTESNRDAWDELRDYAGDYLREEILAEAIVRKIEAFSRFLPVAARMNGELLNFEAVALDSQVPARTVREYFSVLEDTLVGRILEPLRFKGKNSRKAISTGKFYFFDCGVTNALLGRKSLAKGTPEWGSLFESWIHQELVAWLDYSPSAAGVPLNFWRSPTGQEVDFVLGDVAIEVKAGRAGNPRGLHVLADLMGLRRLLVVCDEPVARKEGKVEILPWRSFLHELWADKFVSG